MRTKFVAAADACLCGDELFDSASRGIADVLEVFGRDVGHGVGLSTNFDDIHSAQFDTVVGEHDIEEHGVSWVLQDTLTSLVS